MQQQINAEQERRAVVMATESKKQAAQLEVDAELYTVQKQTEAKKLLADADTYATDVIANAINNNGSVAVEFEIKKRQVDTVGQLSSSDNAKLVMLPNNIIDALQPAISFFKKS